MSSKPQDFPQQTSDNPRSGSIKRFRDDDEIISHVSNVTNKLNIQLQKQIDALEARLKAGGL